MTHIFNALTSFFAAAGDSCNPAHTGFFDFPTWYKYLDGVEDAHGGCIPTIGGLDGVWLIVAAIIEIALRIAAIVAVVFIIYGGFSYTTSQGDPEATARAKATLVNALIGLAVAVMAAVIIAFIARSIE